MTGDSLTPEQPPSGTLYARQGDETPTAGTQRGEGGASGPQTGTQSFGPIGHAQQHASHGSPCDDQTDTELTADEARAEVDRLSLELYRAQDALAFVGELCDIADREGQPVTTSDVRRWLQGVKCGRQLLAEAQGVQPTPAPAGLRDLYAAAIASYDHAVGQATDPAPRGHHYGQADAVLAVRDRELEQVRAEAAEQESTQATPHELESRQRRAWNAAGHCPMCNTDNTGGWLCDDCMTTVRSLPARKRRGWRRYEPPATGAPIQDHGYTPAGLLGLTDDEPPTA